MFGLAALVAVLTYLTGEPAEEMVEHRAGVSKSLIETHAADGHAPSPVPGRVTGSVLVLVLLGTALMARAANRGGQIHHEEIRTGAQAPTTPDQSKAEHEEPGT